jgi:hypothetical protein
LRYNGETLVTPGDRYLHQEIFFEGMYGVYQGSFFSDKLNLVMGYRRDRYNSDTAQYKRFLPSTVQSVIDFYNTNSSSADDITGTEEEKQLVAVNLLETNKLPYSYYEEYDDGNGGKIFGNPNNLTHGLLPSVKAFSKDVIEETKSFGINYKITDDISIFGLYSEGVMPNTGLKDGNQQVLSPELTVNQEIGFKFDIDALKLSGSVSYFVIDRENAIWNYREAPNPSRWADAIYPDPDSTTATPNTTGGTERLFDAVWDSATSTGVHTGITFAICEKMIAEFMPEEYKAVFNSTVGDTVSYGPSGVIFTPIGGTSADNVIINGIINGDPQDYSDLGGLKAVYWIIDYDAMSDPSTSQTTLTTSDGKTVTIDTRKIMEYAIHASKIRDGSIAGQYNVYRDSRSSGDGYTYPNYASIKSSSGSFVTYSDQSTGIDFDLTWSPTKSFQLLFNYIQISREASGAFKMVDYRDQRTWLVPTDDPRYVEANPLNGGGYYGTEYETIVRAFGADAYGLTGKFYDESNLQQSIIDNTTNVFGDPVVIYDYYVDSNGNKIDSSNPLRPSMADSGIDGLSTYFNPEREMSLWAKYTFQDTFLKDLGFGLGVKYSGPGATTVKIGGTKLVENFYVTPETKERYQLNGAIYYKFKTGFADWRLSLNISNIMDDREGETVLVYTDTNGKFITSKRTKTIYSPRSYKFNLAVNF